MNALIENLTSMEMFWNICRAVIYLLAGWMISRVVTRSIDRSLNTRARAQTRFVLRRVVGYGILALAVVMALNALGFDLSILLGAAGILTVAIGFASQTSASNLISGLFLIAERPFEIGNVITIADVTGEVISIDLLSVKLRTPDNLFVRVPNESVIKSNVTNLTRFPIRRFDFKIGVSYGEDLKKVAEILKATAFENPICLDDPAPLFIFLGFGESSLDIQFSVWAKRESFLDMRNSLAQEIKAAFDEHGIQIPFPHRTLTTNVASPLNVALLQDGK